MTVHRLPDHRPDASVPAAERLRAGLYAAADALVELLGEPSGRTPTTSAPGAERLLTAPEVATRTGLSLDYIYRHAKRWPFTRKIGRACRFSEAGLERWLASRRPVA